MSTSERQHLAKRAENALKDYLAECGDMLWPEERGPLLEARRFLAKEAEDG